MADNLDKSVERLQTFVPVEKSLSIDPHLDRDNQRNGHRRTKKKGVHLTVEERLAQEESLRVPPFENDDHVDYHA